MVNAALWDEVSTLPLRDRIELSERLNQTIPELPVPPGIPTTAVALAAALAESRRQINEAPETVMTLDEAVRRLRSKRA
jgi:hypothetical protein